MSNDDRGRCQVSNDQDPIKRDQERYRLTPTAACQPLAEPPQRRYEVLNTGALARWRPRRCRCCCCCCAAQSPSTKGTFVFEVCHEPRTLFLGFSSAPLSLLSRLSLPRACFTRLTSTLEGILSRFSHYLGRVLQGFRPPWRVFYRSSPTASCVFNEGCVRLDCYCGRMLRPRSAICIIICSATAVVEVKVAYGRFTAAVDLAADGLTAPAWLFCENITSHLYCS